LQSHYGVARGRQRGGKGSRLESLRRGGLVPISAAGFKISRPRPTQKAAPTHNTDINGIAKGPALCPPEA